MQHTIDNIQNETKGISIIKREMTRSTMMMYALRLIFRYALKCLGCK